MHIPESHTSQIWVPGEPQAPPGMPDKSARIATVKEHEPSAAATPILKCAWFKKKVPSTWEHLNGKIKFW